MKKAQELKAIRHELRGKVSIIAGRDITDDEYAMIRIMIKKYALASRTDLEHQQQQTLIEQEKTIKKRNEQIKGTLTTNKKQ